DADVGHSLEAIELLGNPADGDVGERRESEQGESTEDARGESVEDPPEAESEDASHTTGRETARTRRSARIRARMREERPVDAASPSDRRHVLAADVVRVLDWRAEAFGDDYPFLVARSESGQ